MIFATSKPHKIGEILNFRFSTDVSLGWHPPQPMLVVRAATAKEWALWVKSQGHSVKSPPAGMGYFYEVTTD